MNKKLYIVLFGAALTTASLLNGMLNSISVPDVYQNNKRLIYEVCDAALNSQHKFNKFYLGLLTDQKQIIQDLIGNQKTTTHSKINDLPQNSNKITTKKIKKSFFYCLPAFSSAALTAVGLYYFNENLKNDTRGLQSLFYSALLPLASGYYCLKSLPSFKVGIYSLYKSFSYKKYLEKKLDRLNEAQKKIDQVPTENALIL